MKVTYKTWTVKELEAAASPVSQPVSQPEKPVSQSVEKPVSQPVEVKKRAVPEVAELPKKPVVPVAFKKSYTKKAPKKPPPQPENENQKPVHVNPNIVELPDYKPETEVVQLKIVSQPVEKPVIQIEKPVIQIEKQEIIELPPAPSIVAEEKTPVVVSDVKYKKKSFDLFPEIKEVRRKYETTREDRIPQIYI